MNTGLVTKENQFIPIPYYQIGTYAEDVCKQYIEQDEVHKIQFETFIKNYSFFKPYLDFLLFELEYKMVNPLLHNNSMWCVENGRLILKSADKDQYYSSVCDKDLGIEYINPENITDCVIDLKGRVYKACRDLGLHHEIIYELIINQYLIYDKELFDIYEEYMKGSLNVMPFARNMLGFYQMVTYHDGTGCVVYCDDFYNSYIDNIFKRIQELNPGFSINPYKIHSKESLEIANKCIEKVGELNENRRLRF